MIEKTTTVKRVICLLKIMIKDDAALRIAVEIPCCKAGIETESLTRNQRVTPN